MVDSNSVKIVKNREKKGCVDKFVNALFRRSYVLADNHKTYKKCSII